MPRKNDYSVIVFTQSNEYMCKSVYVHNLLNYSKWLSSSKNYNDWYYFNVYDRRTGQFLKRFYRNEFIPPFL